MFTDQIFTEPTALSEVIDDIMLKLKDEEPGTKEFTVLVDTLSKLYKLKETDIKLILLEVELEHKLDNDSEMHELNIEEKKKMMKLPFGLKPETVALIAANLLGIAIIVGHERLNVVTTKAVGFVSKLKN